MQNVAMAAIVALVFALTAPDARTEAVSERPKEPTLEITPLDQERIALQDSNVRAGPSPSHEPITILMKGSRVDVTGQVRNGQWFRIALSDGREGFVSGELLGPVRYTGAESTDKRPPPIAEAIAPPAAHSIEDGIEAYEREDYAAALRVWRPLADQALVPAQFNLGLMNSNGQGVAQDYSEAAKWYRKAAVQGHTEAQALLAYMYNNGQGVTQDYAEAVKWYLKAAQRSHAAAQSNLGVMYHYGRGVTQDYAEAMIWYRRAAEQGVAPAQYNVGVMYANGQGVAQDYTEALKWYRMAADRGHAAAQYNLGTLYFKGLGVPLDDVQAHMWYSLAASQGTEDAISNRDRMAGLMTPAQIAEAQKLVREWKPK